MKKSNACKKINKLVKKFNRSLEQDVFGDRFWLRQYQKSRVDDMDYFLYMLEDREEPERNDLIGRWINEYDAPRILFEAMNDFIVRSDFWSIYNNKPESYNADEDFYKKFPKKY